MDTKLSALETDFFDIKMILSTIWKKKYVVLSGLILVSLVFWGTLLTIHLLKPKYVTYSKDLQLVFQGVENGVYPNHTPFNVSDLVMPVVLNKLYDDNQLQRFGISRNTFLRSFSAEEYSPERELILKKYQKVSEQKNISSAELALAQEDIKTEIKKTSRGNVRVHFSSPNGESFPPNLAEKLLSDLPMAWAEHVIEKRGVLHIDKPIYSENLLDEKKLVSLDYLVMESFLREHLGVLKESVESLTKFPNANTIKDEKTGFAVPDLLRLIREIEVYDVPRAMAPVRLLAITKEPIMVKVFFEAQLAELRRKKAEYVNKAEVMKEGYQIYTQQQSASKDSLVSASTGKGIMGTPTIDIGVLERLIKLGDQTKDMEYRQKLNEKGTEFLEKAAEIGGEIDRVEQILAALETPATLEVKKPYIEYIDAKLPDILAKIRSVFRVANEIAAKLSNKNYGNAMTLYKDNSGVWQVIKGGITYHHALLWYLLVMLLSVCVFIPVLVIKQLWSKN